MASYELIETRGGVPIKAWTRGVAIEDAARRQLENVARLPIVFHHVAAMPDVHFGIGATVGSVVPTERAIIPAAVGVDIGCGMMAVETTLAGSQLPDTLGPLRAAIERAVPHGRTASGGRGDRGAWHDIPAATAEAWAELAPDYAQLVARHPRLGQGNDVNHLGTLGPATTSSRSVSTSAIACGSCCTPARAAPATGSGRTSSSSPSGT